MPIKDPAERRAWNKKYMQKLRATPRYRALERARVRRNMRAYRAQVRALLAEFKKQGCLLCAETEPCCLSAHHRDPKQKKFSLNSAVTRGFALERVIAELKKCVCLCENCHRKVHANKVKLPGRVEP